MNTEKKIKFDYTIDGVPYSWRDFITKAKDWGWDSGGFSTTSGAATYLRKIGHIVGIYKEA